MSKHIEFDLQVNASYKPLSKLLVDKDKLKTASRDDTYLSTIHLIGKTQQHRRPHNRRDPAQPPGLNCQIGDMVHVIPMNELREQSA